MEFHCRHSTYKQKRYFVGFFAKHTTMKCTDFSAVTLIKIVAKHSEGYSTGRSKQLKEGFALIRLLKLKSKLAQFLLN